MDDDGIQSLSSPGCNSSLSCSVLALATGGPAPPQEETHFNLKLQIEQLQEKVKFLAGGTTGEELAEVLMEKEEEGRGKDRHIAALEAHAAELGQRLTEAEEDNASLRALAHEQGLSIASLTQQVEALCDERDGLQQAVATAQAEHAVLEAQHTTLQETLTTTTCKAETTHAALMRREAQLTSAAETIKAQVRVGVGVRKESRRKSFSPPTHSSIHFIHPLHPPKPMQERSMEDLLVRKEGVATRAREVQAGLEQQVGEEQARAAGLKGQLRTAQQELGEVKKQLAEMGRRMEENLAREQGLAQSKGKMEVRLTALLEEKKQLQGKLVKMIQERKVLDSLSVSNGNKTTKLEDDLQGMYFFPLLIYLPPFPFSSIHPPFPCPPTSIHPTHPPTHLPQPWPGRRNGSPSSTRTSGRASLTRPRRGRATGKTR